MNRAKHTDLARMLSELTLLHFELLLVYSSGQSYSEEKALFEYHLHTLYEWIADEYYT